MRLLIAIMLLISLLGCKKYEINLATEVYGHAGTTLKEGNWIFPPNSYASIEYVLFGLNADGCEVDLQMTKDSVLVLFHNDYLFPVIKKDGCIAEYNWSDLKNEKIYGTNRTLTKFSEVLPLFVENNKRVIIDFKAYNACDNGVINTNGFKWAFENALQNLSDDQKYKSILFTSRSAAMTQIMENSTPKYFETENFSQALYLYEKNFISGVVMKNELLESDSLNLILSSGMDLIIFGGSSRQEIKKVLNFGPNGYITDNAATALSLQN